MSILDVDPELLRFALTDPSVPPAKRRLVARAIVDRYFVDARDSQKPPHGDWSTWMLRAGRGFGKTRTGAEWIIDEALEHRGTYAVAAPTFGDARDICVEGESGILTVLGKRHRRHTWNRSLGELRLDNGSRLKVGSADEPDRFRGYNFAGAWCDELASWRRPDAFTQIRLATRLGRARIVVTTTPRPTKLVKDLLEQPTTHVTSGSTFDNAKNLTPAALDELRRRYENTRIGRQELYGELLLDVEGALWQGDWLERDRVEQAPPLRRVVVAVDPAVTSGEDADDTGIVAVGVDYEGELYVLADRTCHLSPDRSMRVAVDLYDELEGDRIVAEVNNGCEFVGTVLRTVDPSVPYRAVHASKGKRIRAEPIAALYEQGRVHHVGVFPELEEQLTTWTPEQPGSPDRLDALVWAVTDLAIEPVKRRRRSIVGVSAA